MHFRWSLSHQVNNVLVGWGYGKFHHTENIRKRIGCDIGPVNAIFRSPHPGFQRTHNWSGIGTQSCVQHTIRSNGNIGGKRFIGEIAKCDGPGITTIFRTHNGTVTGCINKVFVFNGRIGNYTPHSLENICKNTRIAPLCWWQGLPGVSIICWF